MGHRRDITEQWKGKWYNVSTVRAGRQMSVAEAMSYAIRNDLLGRAYDTLEDAEKAARAYSEGTRPHRHRRADGGRDYKKALRDSLKKQKKK